MSGIPQVVRPKFLPFWILLTLALLLAAILPWTSKGKRFIAGPPKEVVKTVIEKVEVEKIVEVEKPARVIYANHKNHDIRKTSKGFDLLSKVDIKEGGLASAERVRGDAYFAEYCLTATKPTPAKSLNEVEIASPHLTKILPSMAGMIESAQVSQFYDDIYERKMKNLKKAALTLDGLLTTHNLYDLQTILNLTHPETGRKVLLLQSEMDVVTDGSDGDRMPAMPDEIVNSTHYQFSTSYWWPKVTDRPNPMVAGFENRIVNANKEIASGKADAARKGWLMERIKMLKGKIKEGKAHSFLIAQHDPFIVMPTQMIIDRQDSHSPRAGDYACVIYKDKIYPAIVGDAGPTYKAGEASLRIAKELNPIASSYHRPISDLTVTYLVFSQSRGDKKPPNYADWHAECSKLIKEIGGLGEGVTLHEWADTLPPIVEEEEGVENDPATEEVATEAEGE